MQMAEYSKQQAGVQNEYVLMLVSANAHLEHYYHVELPAIMQVGAAWGHSGAAGTLWPITVTQWVQGCVVGLGPVSLARSHACPYGDVLSTGSGWGPVRAAARPPEHSWPGRGREL